MKTNQKAFTLLEVLIVVAIIAILAVATVLGVSKQIDTHKKTALTKLSISLLSVAIAEFYDITGHYPIDHWPDNWDAKNAEGQYIYIGCRIRYATVSGGDLPGPSDLLYLQLNLLPQTQKIISKLPNQIVMPPPASAATVSMPGQTTEYPYPTSYLLPLQDPWGNMLDYQTSNGFPKIWSYGPDKEDGTPDDIGNKH